MNAQFKPPVDPKADLLASVGDIDGVELFHNQVLVATYERPKVTAGGIIRPDSNLKEDHYQGKVGLVLKVGPMAFRDDGHVHFHGQNVEIGDWVAYRHSDGWPVNINGERGKHCRLLEDSHIKMRLDNPDRVF